MSMDHTTTMSRERVMTLSTDRAMMPPVSSAGFAGALDGGRFGRGA
jgi:hypothetical protein